MLGSTSAPPKFWCGQKSQKHWGEARIKSLYIFFKSVSVPRQACPGSPSSPVIWTLFWGVQLGPVGFRDCALSLLSPSVLVGGIHDTEPLC